MKIIVTSSSSHTESPARERQKETPNLKMRSTVLSMRSNLKQFGLEQQNERFSLFPLCCRGVKKKLRRLRRLIMLSRHVFVCVCVWQLIHRATGDELSFCRACFVELVAGLLLAAQVHRIFGCLGKEKTKAFHRK